MADLPLPDPEHSPLSPLDAIRARTPARILIGRAGPAYRTETLLDLRSDHAAAVDAVRAELDIERDLGLDLIDQFRLFEVSTQATSKKEYLMQPDLGRKLSESAHQDIDARCLKSPTLQVVIGDGLSVAAVARQVGSLLPLLEAGARERGWQFGQPFVIRYCRVGVLNDVGDRLTPTLAVLLIGERPGLATAESLSAYMAYQPRSGHTDANRNLISNIHVRGIDPPQAVEQIFALATAMIRHGISGVKLGTSTLNTAIGHDAT